MRWLVTFDQSTDIGELKEWLREWECNLPRDSNLIPLGESETVVEVEGPQNLPQLASSSEREIKVYPSSKVEPFSMSN